MAMMDIDAGRLTARLVLERPEAVEDGQGGVAMGFVELARVWALVEPRSFAEEEKGPGLVATVTHHVTVRALGHLVAGQRFRKGARVFEILAVRDPDETGRFQLALCREVTG
ncbi:phage head closure protein [Allorhizobium sp. NPDC080224]|uniref:phage head closure protein n=1 Tax=Allorhizobium sp. NPDC080224 TaxID=3390547 RepID=UPI003CFFB4FB